LAFQPDSLSNTPILPIEEVTSSYYLRLRVADVTGVLADITRILADTGISIDALLQKESEQVDANGKGETDIILITHETVEKHVNAAIRTIEALKTVVSQVTKLRMEALN
ncbi:MAG TPA: ACT domain-containing protein, partial [Paraburkholderia sp.]|nr:ACT domain-containing protein [Paraburkholderia sp.]